ncbi:MAG: YdcF family protein [Oscillospiraceae bacterium]|nr:YdcF family protein [Oscillospiraceae bacterium]
MKRIHPKWFLCAVPALAGAFLFFCLPGYRFAGLALLGLSALIPVYHFLKQDFFRRVLTALLALGFVVLSITGGTIARSAHGTGSQHADYLIVLGCQVRGTEPSRMLRQRLDAAATYLSTNADTHCIVTGGKGDGENLSEAQCMYNYLTAAGIDPSRITMEDQATSTMENLRYSMEFLEPNAQIAIVSNEFHLYRADQMARQLGLSPALIPASTEYPILLASYTLREILAVWKFHLFGG